MTFLVQWVGAPLAGVAVGVFCSALLCSRRLTAKSEELRIERKHTDQLHLQVAHKHRELSLVEKHHEEETRLWMRVVKLLETAASDARLHQRHYDAVIECKDRELREVRQTVVGVEQMSERLAEFEDFAVCVRGYIIQQGHEQPGSAADEIMKIAEALVPGPILTSIEEVERGDEEARQTEETATARA